MKKNDFKLVLYSGGKTSKNHRIHQAMAQLASKRGRTSLSLTYIPFCSDDAEIYFQRAVRRYQKFGFKKFTCLPVDQSPNPALLSRALKSDVIYLAGGNTFYFLKHLRKSGLISELKKFVKEGGVLAGLSAGAIILTPHIHLAGYPDFDADENDVNLKNLRSLDLARFEFFPHYESTSRLDTALKRYSATTPFPIIACPDGSGLVLNGDQKTLVGESWIFSEGKKIAFI
jgi:dipeptidase E